MQPTLTWASPELSFIHLPWLIFKSTVPPNGKRGGDCGPVLHAAEVYRVFSLKTRRDSSGVGTPSLLGQHFCFSMLVNGILFHSLK